MIIRPFFICTLIGCLFFACSQSKEQSISQNSEQEVSSAAYTGPLFSNLSPERTGIEFENTVSETAEFNNLSYPLMLNGAGVAVGDINNDGLPDIFLAGNMVSSRLYLNNGDMQFEDITASAGMTTNRWITGASMVDINNDGYLDIYLSVASPEDSPPEDRANMLFINNRNNTFSEKAEEYHIADTNHTTDAVFLDYNRDGLLDLFLLNHSPGMFSQVMEGNSQSAPISKSYDRLYKNNGDGTFSDVSTAAGILQTTGYGLGAVSTDINRDGWPDIYVSNDIDPDDVFYINNQDGTFSDRSKAYLKHTSYAGMGIDIADFNNDGWQDIMQVDMMPSDYQDRKLMSYGVNYERNANDIARGHNYTYSKNSLQMNNGIDDSGNLVFSEISRIAGVAYTDWSWAPLFGDFDNNGYRDILITNGYPKATYDFDYVVEKAQLINSGGQDLDQEKYQLYQALPSIKIPNYLFKNEGGIIFSDVSQAWGFNDSTYSYGAAYADLDNDGSLDLVINNLNAPASIYKNNSRALFGSHYLTIKLEGPENNKMGIGSEIVLNTGGEKQYAYSTPYRGYESSVDPRIHFGIGQNTEIDSLEVFWPDGQYQLLTDIEPDQQLTVSYGNAGSSTQRNSSSLQNNRHFSEISEEVNLIYNHQEDRFNDYRLQPLLHRQLSKMGPKVAVGDVTGNGLDDIYIGGAADSPGALFIQQDDGTFEEFNENQPWLADQASEDIGATFFDANNDGLLDLYVASGGYEFSPAEDAILDRLYINIGGGKFYKDDSALPRMYSSSSQVVPGDFNSDGQMDLFVGGRLIPFKYPFPARSYILENNNGNFTDVTQQVAPGLVKPGLITDAVWTDFNGDGRLDLVTAGIWMPIQFYANAGGTLEDVTASEVEDAPRGWWYSLGTGDFNGDGSTDLIAGNLGLNHTFTTSQQRKFGVYANDFNDDLTTDIVYTIEEEGGAQYPFFGEARMGPAIGFINDRYKTFKSFSKETMNDIFGADALNSSLHYQADTFASTLFLSQGDGTFATEQLPEEAQISPIEGIVSYDVDQDGNMDLILGGNIFSTHPDITRSDAGNGLWMRGDGRGGFESVLPYQSGLYAPGDAKDVKLITTPNGQAVVIAQNDGPLKIFRIE